MRGREPEFALIGELVAAAARGAGSIVVVTGQAGIGKTRLLRSAIKRAAAAGLRTGWGDAADSRQAAPLVTLMSALFTGPGPLLDRARLRELRRPRSSGSGCSSSSPRCSRRPRWTVRC
jgi:type II secretory pathway predicted ATPase ExeA